MIPDWETTHLFLSGRLETAQPAVLAGLRSALKGVPVGFLHGTRDIWCRDFMPIQLDESRFCQFVYNPDYLKRYKHLITPPEVCRLHLMQNYRQEPIVLDGGNVLASRTRVILTDKVFRANGSTERSRRSRLKKRLEQIFQAECIFLPEDPEDEFGHSDGMVRFLAEGRVFINDYSSVDPSFGAELRNLLEEKELEVLTLPMFEEKRVRRPGKPLSAVGLYINYLRVGDVVVMPAYDRPEDQAAVEKVRQALPNALVYQVPCRRLAEEGGVLNCISWAIKHKT